jgi:OmpR family response regulator RpaB
MDEVSVPPTILVVDDQEMVRRLLELRLTKAGFQVILAADGQEALERFNEESPDLLVLDLMLPVLDGFEVCQRIRKQSQVPIVMLSGRSDVLERVTGLELGADDYLVKPFSPRELEMRIRALLRRSVQGELQREQGSTITAGELRVDTYRQQVFKGTEQVRLTDLEYRLLSILLSQPGKPWSRVELLRKVWGYVPTNHARVRTIDVHVARLRSKLEADPEHPEFILTERGTGYLFRRLLQPAL